MAITETIVYTCDVCSAVEPVQEVRYAVRGKELALDMCNTCYATFNALWAPYIAASSPVRHKNHVVRRDGKKKAEPLAFVAIPVESEPVKKKSA